MSIEFSAVPREVHMGPDILRREDNLGCISLHMHFSYLSIWIDSTPIVWDFSLYILIFDIREIGPMHITFPQIIIKHKCETLLLYRLIETV